MVKSDMSGTSSISTSGKIIVSDEYKKNFTFPSDLSEIKQCCHDMLKTIRLAIKHNNE